MLFKKLGLSDVICIGHDMGDTVLAELVKRRHRGTLPNFLNIKGVAFTNGGINFKYAKLRLAQHLLRYSKLSIVLTETLRENPILDQG